MEIQAAEAIAIFIIIIDKKSLYSCQLLRSQDFTCFYIYRCNLKTETDVKGEELFPYHLPTITFSQKSDRIFFFLEWLLRNFSEKKKREYQWAIVILGFFKNIIWSILTAVLISFPMRRFFVYILQVIPFSSMSLDNLCSAFTQASPFHLLIPVLSDLP